MAWQLIYTSAPRLLEAGRSGFGTVARHRDIPPLVVGAVERISQFSRQQGLDPARVIYAHRILNISGQRFHVLSCIRDAGADYTGRTNHLAHHLIAEPHEVTSLGISSADVLMQMPWLTAWTEQPRWLEVQETIPLASFPSATGVDGPHWGAVTGDPRHAQLLANGDASHGCYLVAPANTDLRPLLAESLNLARERRWQVAFTTSLQPSDEPTDFRWLGLEATSPLRAATETSGRIVLDLARPHTLPAPPAPPAPATPRIERASSPAHSSVVEPVPVTTASAPGSTAPVFRDDRWARQKERAVESEPTRTTQRKTSKWLWVSVATAVFLAVASLGAVVLYRRAALKTERTRLLAFLPDFARTGPKGSIALEGLRWSTRNKAQSLASAANVVRDALESGKLDNVDPQPLQSAVRAAENEGINADAYRTLLDVARLVASSRDEVRIAKTPDATLRFDKATWDKSISAFPTTSAGKDGFQPSRDALQRLCLEREARALEEAFQNNTDRQISVQSFKAAVATLNEKLGKLTPPTSLVSIRGFISDWDQVVGNVQLEPKPDWPQWLRAYAQPSTPVSKPADAAPAAKSMERPPTQPEKPKVPTYLAIGMQELSELRVSQLKPEVRFEYSEGDTAKALRLINQALFPEGNVRTPAFDVAFDVQRISAGSAAPQAPCRLIGRGKNDEQLFAIIILPEDNSEPLMKTHSLALRRDKDRIMLTGDISALGDASDSRLALLLPPSIGTMGGSNSLDLDASRTGSIAGPIKKLEESIKKLEDAAAAYRTQAQQSVGGATTFDSIHAKANRFASSLKGQGAELWKSKTGSQKESQHVVGDFAKALADEWNAKNEKRFDKLRSLGDTLDRAQPAEILKANVALLEEITSLLKSVKDGDKATRLRDLQSLANELTNVLDPTEPERRKKALTAQAEKKEAEATALRDDPVLKSEKVPPGEYRLILRSPSNRVALIAVIKASNP